MFYVRPHLRFSRRFLALLAVFAIVAGHRAAAQIKEAETGSLVHYGATQVSSYRVGVTVKARGSDVHNVFAVVAVPLVCDEQEVELLEEDLSPQVAAIDYRSLGAGARQMLVKIPFLGNGDKAHALLTFEVRTRIILPPEKTDQLTIPAKPDRQLKRYLGKSPFIQTKHSKFRKVLKEIAQKLEASTDDAEALTDWQRVEAIYDYVQDSIEYLEGPDKSALETLKDGQGDCQNISALFVALCRTNKIPARIVWVHEHNYMEFCLVDGEGKPHWFPCESSGSRAFGEMPLARTILQKGDSFKMPEKPREVLRYASDFATAQVPPGGSKPRIKFVREEL